MDSSDRSLGLPSIEENNTSVTKRHGYAVLSALVALVVVLSAVIYITVAADDGTPRGSFAGDRPHRDSSVAPASTGTWVGSWSTAPAGGEPGTETAGLAGRSVRNVVHASTAGTSARITLSN